MANFLVGGETSLSREGSLTPQQLTNSASFSSRSSRVYDDTSGGFVDDDAMATLTHPAANPAANPGGSGPMTIAGHTLVRRSHTWAANDPALPSGPSSLPQEFELHNISSLRPSPSKRRHYKKDSRYVLDLYTLTFDEDETVDELETCKTMAAAGMDDGGGVAGAQFYSLAPSTVTSISMAESLSSGQMSLGSNYSSAVAIGAAAAGGAAGGAPMMAGPRPNALPSLETNLHKILARKIQDSEDVSFRKAKLLTKAYYKLLRESASPIVDPQLQVERQQRMERATSKRIGEGRLSWQTLLRTDPSELKRTVAGLGNTVRALNEYLMELLEERDDLLSQQDNMLEEISELTDNLL